MKKFLTEAKNLTPSELRKILIPPFWCYTIIIWQLFYPSIEDDHTRYFFILVLSCVLSIASFWLVALFEKETEVTYLDLPYNLFYHYKLKNGNRSQFIYLVRRLADGVYKIGKATHLDKRAKSLRREYGPISIVAVWEVQDGASCERVALSTTELFSYKEEGHQELRAMSNLQCWQFISNFTAYVAELDTFTLETQADDQLQMPELWS